MRLRRAILSVLRRAILSVLRRETGFPVARRFSLLPLRPAAGRNRRGAGSGMVATD